MVTGRILGGDNITYFSYVAIFGKNIWLSAINTVFFFKITLLMYVWTIYISKKYILIYWDDFLTRLNISECVSFFSILDFKKPWFKRIYDQLRFFFLWKCLHQICPYTTQMSIYFVILMTPMLHWGSLWIKYYENNSKPLSYTSRYQMFRAITFLKIEKTEFQEAKG